MPSRVTAPRASASGVPWAAECMLASMTAIAAAIVRSAITRSRRPCAAGVCSSAWAKVGAGLPGKIGLIARFIDDRDEVARRRERRLVHHTRGVRQQIHCRVAHAGGAAQGALHMRLAGGTGHAVNRQDDRLDRCLDRPSHRRVLGSVLRRGCRRRAIRHDAPQSRLCEWRPDTSRVRRVRMESCCADSYFIHMRSRDLIQHACDALHACSAVHALDLEEQFCHIPPPPIRYDAGSGRRMQTFTRRRAGCFAGQIDSRCRARSGERRDWPDRLRYSGAGAR